jgi:uncharacterized membrane protein
VLFRGNRVSVGRFLMCMLICILMECVGWYKEMVMVMVVVVICCGLVRGSWRLWWAWTWN